MRRRLWIAGGLVALVAFYLLFLRLEPAHLSTLVPADFSFGVFTSSLNDLRQLYEAPYQHEDADPARLRFGRPANVPGLDGVSYDEPAGSYWTADKAEIFLLPVRDESAFEDAFERERENIHMEEPERVAKNYVSLSEKRVHARRGRRNELVLRASKYPLALCGYPRDALTLRMMLTYLLLREPDRKPSGIPLLVQAASRLPNSVAGVLADECEDLLLGFPLSADGAVRVDGEASLARGSIVARSAHLAAEVDLTDMAGSFPYNTSLFLGLVLDRDGWQELGLPLPVGDGAFAIGLVEEKIHARRFTVLAAARPRDDADLARLAADGYRPLAGGTGDLEWNSLEDQTSEVRTAMLPEPPAWLAQVLRSDADAPPPVYVSTAVERGIWYCAIGSQAEGTVRRALGCLRESRELGLARVSPIAKHPEFLRGPHVGLALVTASGLEAFDFTVPYFEIASLGQPPSATVVIDVDEHAEIDIRIER